ncbi:hypothetical protein [Novosphingobium mangrovi (ex Huang et al. 2023)]|uniref:SIR2-like domain-containing protein n=1 Tax=Novosphingobium mangrovi (ex Huang et al. 2023) TaxID=2976432 RepID=A0ABT2I2I8_9SPHN|nr:hypothetical protein [Novosphingobium mangrovi (ex Huang et al. 2023)]MCT2399017.1 hypothetical protein [Novosphingobium mangrovi (ex Huang et al. 2023)]
MFRQKTTIVVGAGASCELGLPSGDGLKDQIVSLLERTNENAYGFSDNTMLQIMRSFAGADVPSLQNNLQPYKAAADRILRGLPLALSIDNFLHSHQDDPHLVDLGKLCIAICILRAERSSYLFQRSNMHALFSERDEMPQASTRGEKLAKTWYPAFARLLMSGVQRNNIKEAFENVRFVIFNYDRCLEQFIWMALQDYFDIDGEEAAEVLEDVRFNHPYGSLGVLPWRGQSEANLPLGGGDDLDYWKIGKRLQTFTESVRSQVVHNVAQAVHSADTLLVLGFGYLDQNLQLLRPQMRGNAKRAISTAYGVSDADQRILKQALLTLGNQSPEMTYLEPGSCSELFDHFHLMLSLS